jgi:hypothetical protein
MGVPPDPGGERLGFVVIDQGRQVTPGRITTAELELPQKQTSVALPASAATTALAVTAIPLDADDRAV